MTTHSRTLAGSTDSVKSGTGDVLPPDLQSPVTAIYCTANLPALMA